MGELAVPADALWGAQTQRAVQNLPLSGLGMPRAFIRALGLIKWAAASANEELALLPSTVAQAIQSAALEVADGDHDRHFPVDVFQTGSGTSSNMNANEVIAQLASRTVGTPVHANDHVNMGQSSNDVIPAAIHVSAAVLLNEQLLPALMHLHGSIERKATELQTIVVTGRTHLMDAMPVTLAQELSGWAKQIELAIARLRATQPRLHSLALGGTAVGTGINTNERFAELAIARLSRATGIEFREAANHVERQSTRDTIVYAHGALNTLAVSFT
ncbi:MAG TPA: lyase family protein, partial [Roseiflexaceae bacterium]|nr:lyase family protein [Roseiflexaceae bacterium]